MPQGFAVESATSVEIVAAWTTPATVVSAVAASPGWRVIGEYYLPKSCAARLDVVHLVSAVGLTSRVRLWDTLDGAVPGSVETGAVVPTRSLGGMVQLTGGRTYQIQAECTGAAPAYDKFSAVLAATISD